MKMHFAEAPSNIALIKYMGKISAGTQNFPANASLSVTLPHLKTRVEVQEDSSLNTDTWSPLLREGWQEIDLSEAGIARYLKHWQFLKKELGLQGCYHIQSTNNFPSDCGLASSASSFAALTMAARAVIVDRGEDTRSDQDWANLSRQGSGSSCRSFFGPLVFWKDDHISAFKWTYEPWMHQVVVVDEKKKQVSSSEAHKRVCSSLLNEGRAHRAALRIEDLKNNLDQKNWRGLFEVIWAEFWDMHALFETSQPSFGYMTAQSLLVLKDIHAYWQEHEDGPLVTMDAGANIHLLYRQDQKQLANAWQSRWQGVAVYA